MARSHARIFTVIWDDADFLALSGLAQRAYFMLLTQPDLRHAGVLPTTFRRWTFLSTDEDEGQLRTALRELAEARFVVIDERTEELLVRTLIRNDDVWKQPKVLAVAIAEAAAIRSPVLRAVVAEELGRIDPQELPDTTRPAVEELLHALPKRLADARSELDKHPHAQGGPHPPADPPSQGDAEGVRVRARAAPTPATVPDPHPHPVPLPAGASKPRAAKSRASSGNAGDVVAAYVEGALAAQLPRPDESLRKRVGKQAGEILARGETTLEVLTAAARNMGAAGWNDLAVQVQRDAKASSANGSRPVGKQTNFTDEEYTSGW